MQFELNEVTAKLLHLNARGEIHGEDNVPAGDLKIKVDLGNDCLAMFHPALKSMLYHFDQSADQDLVDEAQKQDPEYKPHLRFPNIPAIKPTDQCTGASVTIHQGVPGSGKNKADICLDLCNIDNFVIEPKQGGTCSITFRIQAHPDEKASGKLWALIGSNIMLSIAPPAAEVPNE